jgi:hypothetical protein
MAIFRQASGREKDTMSILKHEVAQKIDSYLSGKLSKRSVSAWAIEVVSKEIFMVDETLVEDAVTALAGLHDDSERWDTAEEDLRFLKECLDGKKSYLTRLETLRAA